MYFFCAALKLLSLQAFTFIIFFLLSEVTTIQRRIMAIDTESNLTVFLLDCEKSTGSHLITSPLISMTKYVVYILQRFSLVLILICLINE